MGSVIIGAICFLAGFFLAMVLFCLLNVARENSATEEMLDKMRQTTASTMIEMLQNEIIHSPVLINRFASGVVDDHLHQLHNRTLIELKRKLKNFDANRRVWNV
ncbi:MAG: hypothetical protein SVM79_00150 [Chloroflexota bacterium]|nr:hypothetical protein [Chloroflexota bacterium]